MDITKETIEKAYKKLKSSVYFDKTQLVLRNKLVEFEQEHQKEGVDEYLCKAIFKSLGDEDKFKILVDNICSEISVTSLPKKIADVNSDIIINSVSNEVEIKELQHYIDMPVEGHKETQMTEKDRAFLWGYQGKIMWTI